jgi:hypothetical protein
MGRSTGIGYYRITRNKTYWGCDQRTFSGRRSAGEIYTQTYTLYTFLGAWAKEKRQKNS